MNRFREKFKRSYFVVNKLYLFLIFIGLILQDLTLGMYYFIISLFIYSWRTLTSRVPMSTPKDIKRSTYTYKKTPSRELKLDIYYPQNKNYKPYPLVYFCHGGGWISGFRNQPNNVSWCKFLASKGFAVASIDYRYGFKNNMDDILSDYNDGLNYIRKKSKKFHIDKNNIVLMGLSAGGHLSLLYASYNTYINNKEKMKGIKSVVAYYSPSNLEDVFSTDNKSIFAKFATTRTLKGSPTQVKEIYDYYSPINYISQAMIPSLIVHGKLDNTVPFESSINLVRRLSDYNIPHGFLVHKKGGHSFDTKLKDYNTINILDKTVRFIRKSIKKGQNNENNRY